MTETVHLRERKAPRQIGLAASLRRLARTAINKCRVIIERPIRGSARLSSLYYFLLSREFDLEHQAVLSGKRAVSRTADSSKKIYILRRSIHRLEKGLVMRPRRKVFGEDYIDSTVAAYLASRQDNLLSKAEEKWFSDVLRTYFEVVGSTPVIDVARARFFDVVTGASNMQSVPYSAKLKTSTRVSYEDFDALARRRSSVRWYQDRPVPQDLIRAAIDTACNAPSACNRQPYSFHVSANREAAVALAKCTGGASGFAENVQCVVAVTGNLAAYIHERDRHIIYIDASLAAMQFLLALETLGLSSCVINWPDVPVHERKIRDLLDIAVYERVIMLISLGYADPEGGVPFSQKNRSEKVLKLVSLNNG